MNVEGLACYVIGARQVCVAVNFTDTHPECKNGLPVALVRGCAVARDHAELARQALRPEQLGSDPLGVRIYVEPDTTDVFAVPGWWHPAAYQHHRAETRAVRSPPSSRVGYGPDVTARPTPRCLGP